jgi:hypothetical protein
MIAAKIKFVQTIAAQPGYYLLESMHGDDGTPAVAHQEPIVAWALEDDNYAPYPITLEGVQTSNEAVLRPDGTVAIACIEWHPSVTAWLESLQGATRGKVRQ